jgi:enoyl-CoA hydratase
MLRNRLAGVAAHMVVEEGLEPEVLVRRRASLGVLVLNRPRALNSLTLKMIRSLRRALEESFADPEVGGAVLWGAGDKGFCAGGDVKVMARLVQEGNLAAAEEFFREEYDLDLRLHRAPKPIIVLADGITMGGGLGLAAGADLVIATERTRMAMPETRIGFFPDVGATGWLSDKCPPGYPEFLGLTGFEVRGPETVRLGLATHLAASSRLADLKETLSGLVLSGESKVAALAELNQSLADFFLEEIPAKPELDRQVTRHFAGKDSVQKILASLARGAARERFCQETLTVLQQRSPTALALTLDLIRRNRGRPLGEVFAAEFRAACFMLRHPDYLEGVRARVIDKDDRPLWRPALLKEVQLNF